MASAIRFIVHDLAQSVAALRAGVEFGARIVIESPPGAAGYWGAPYFLAMIAAARAAVPEARCDAVLDCGDAPGAAMEAIRVGVPAVRLVASTEVAERIGDIALQSGARVEMGPAPADALDLADARDPLAVARRFVGAKEY